MIRPINTRRIFGHPIKQKHLKIGMPPKKRTKYENDETVLETILNEVGNDWITQQWTNML